MNLKRLILDFLFSISLGTAIGLVMGLLFYIGGYLTGLLNDKQLKLMIPGWTIGGFIIGLSGFIDRFLRRP